MTTPSCMLTAAIPNLIVLLLPIAYLPQLIMGSVGADAPKPTGFFLGKSGIGDRFPTDSIDESLNSVWREKAKNFGLTEEQKLKVDEYLTELSKVEAEEHHIAYTPLQTSSTEDNNQTLNVSSSTPTKEVLKVSSAGGRKGAGRKRLRPAKTNPYKTKSVKAKSGKFLDSTAAVVENPEEVGSYFQGDIVLFPDQAKSIVDAAKRRSKNHRQKRKFIASPFRRWDPKQPIYYSFDGSHTTKGQAVIFQALEHWQNITCLNFVRKDQSPPQGNQIVFTDSDGCASNVGRHPLGDPQFVSIAPECMRLGVIAHEVAHALGFWHEQSRPDRDKHVTVVWSNIESGSTGQFTKESQDDVDDEGIQYDYGSIMHYRSKAFAKTEDLFTIETNVRDYQRTIGQRDQLSFNDIKLMNKVYCSNSCPAILPCKRGGYTDPRKCDICRCPDGFTGRLCEDVMPGFAANCGGAFDVSSPFQFTSPNYPNLFKEGMECSWLFRAPVGQHVALSFSDQFDLYCKAKHSLCMDYVEVRNSSDFANTGMRYCCYSTPSSTIYSAGNELLVLFRSYYRSGRGFKATVTTTSPNGQWGGWSDWSSCSQSCGGCGTQTRIRDCLPRGSLCLGESTEVRHCNANPCATCTESRIVVVPCGLWGLFRCEKVAPVFVPCKTPCCEGFSLTGNVCVRQFK